MHATGVWLKPEALHTERGTDALTLLPDTTLLELPSQSSLSSIHIFSFLVL